ncbi:MAG: hypothetical protein ABR607_02830 [Pyrinomonadaceae bacterium]
MFNSTSIPPMNPVAIFDRPRGGIDRKGIRIEQFGLRFIPF